jgi:hypothetical protein
MCYQQAEEKKETTATLRKSTLVENDRKENERKSTLRNF